jgi:hypothetical protein
MQNEIVILEDNAERRHEMLARLHDRLPPMPVRFFTGAEEANAYLRQHLQRVQLISLDHDLEPQSPGDADPGTGRDVANFLVSRPPVCPVIIHSTNLPASIAMECDLSDHGWKVQRVTPYEGVAWIDREWFWAVRDALLMFAEPIGAETLRVAKELIARAGGVIQAKAAVDHLAALGTPAPTK